MGSPLLALLNLTIPVATVYGSEDAISPAHQGEMLRELSGIETHRYGVCKLYGVATELNFFL